MLEGQIIDGVFTWVWRCDDCAHPTIVSEDQVAGIEEIECHGCGGRIQLKRSADA